MTLKTTLARPERTPKRVVHIAILEGREVENYDRPKTRGDCLGYGVNAQRPCPWASCRHHLLLDVTAQGAVVLLHGHDDVTRIGETCALDLVDAKGDLTLSEVGAVWSLSRERIRQIESIAMKRVLKRAPELAAQIPDDDKETDL